MKKKKGALTRRDFIRGTVGVTLGTSLVGLNWSKAKGASAGSSLVTIVRDKNAMDAGKNVNTDVLKKMLEQTLIKFTGEENVKDAWLSLVKIMFQQSMKKKSLPFNFFSTPCFFLFAHQV